MPTYDYECDACEHKFELYQSISADPEKVCPKCKKKKLRRLIGTGGAIVFKGSGFYQTDYRSESYKKSASADSGSTSSSSDKSSSDSKSTSEASSKPKADSTPKSESTPAKSKGKKAE
jgi:putative FmdB family regulatory protein